MDLPFHEPRGGEEGKALQVSGGNPKLRGEICRVGREDPHPFVGQSMQKIQPPNKEIGDSDKNQIGVIDDRTGIPGKNENAEGDGDAEGFRDAVEEEKIVKARQVEAQEE
jgi:hypothetical protein